MKKFLQDNIVLSVGIMLPIVMIALFGLATLLPKYFVAPPQYDVIYTAPTNYYDNAKLTFSVKAGKLKLMFNCDDACIKNGAPRGDATLFLFDAKSLQTRAIAINLPSIPPGSKPFVTEIKIPELSNATIDPTDTAPDGYRYENGNDRNSSLISDLFFNNRSPTATITKNANRIVISSINKSYYSNNINFIGWLVSKGP